MPPNPQRPLLGVGLPVFSRVLLICTASLAFFTAVYLAHGPQDPAEVRGDAQVYLSAYSNPRDFNEAPFSYRILTPLAARLVPADASGSFLAVTLFGLVTTTVLLYALVAGIAGERHGVIAAALFAASPLATLTVKNHYLVDPLAAALITAAVLSAVRCRWWLVGCIVAVGALARENVLFVLPGILPPLLYDRRWRIATAITVPGVAVYLVLHDTPLWFGEVPPDFGYLTWERVSGTLRLPDRLTDDLPAAVLVSLGPVAAAGAIGFRRAPSSLRWMCLMLVPILASNAFAADSLRLTGYAFVVTIPLASLLRWRTGPAIGFVATVWLLSDAAQLLDDELHRLAADLLLCAVAGAILLWNLRDPHPASATEAPTRGAST